MTTNLFVIANVKQLRTDGSFRILLPFFLTSWGVGALNSAIFNSFQNEVDFGLDFGGPSEFRGGGGFKPLDPPPPFGTPLSVRKNKDILIEVKMSDEKFGACTSKKRILQANVNTYKYTNNRRR